MEIMIDEQGRLNDQEREMMREIGIIVVPAYREIDFDSPVTNRTRDFQRKFMKVTHADGTVTDGNGDLWQRSVHY